MSTSHGFKAPEFGLPVNLSQANKYYAEARKIEDENQEKLEKIFKDDPEAKAYYSSPAYGFIFSKENIEGLLAKMTSDDHYLILFQGAKTTGTITADKVGRRTLVAMVYKAVPENGSSQTAYATSADQKSDSSQADAKADCTILKLDECEFSTTLGSGSGSEHPGVVVMASKTVIPKVMRNGQFEGQIDELNS